MKKIIFFKYSYKITYINYNVFTNFAYFSIILFFHYFLLLTSIYIIMIFCFRGLMLHDLPLRTLYNVRMTIVTCVKGEKHIIYELINGIRYKVS